MSKRGEEGDLKRGTEDEEGNGGKQKRGRSEEE